MEKQQTERKYAPFIYVRKKVFITKFFVTKILVMKFTKFFAKLLHFSEYANKIEIFFFLGSFLGILG